MKVVFNGKDIEVPQSCSVQHLLDLQDVRRVAVWIDGTQIFFPDYETTKIPEGSDVVAIGPLGGGQRS